MQIIAVDWSGKAKGPEESLWRAEVRQGRLTELRNGLGRGGLIAKLLELGEAEPRMVIGLDFAFSFPAWWCEENGWSSGEDVWSAMEHEGEEPRVVEIYPRALTGPVNKGRWSARHDYLLEHFPEQPRDLLERAAGSEDAFDAAVSALGMSKHEAELRALGPPAHPADRVEGKIWRPQ